MRTLEVRLQVTATKEEQNKLLDHRRQLTVGYHSGAFGVDADMRSPGRPRATTLGPKRGGRERSLQLVRRPNTLHGPRLQGSDLKGTQGMSQITEAASQSLLGQSQPLASDGKEQLSEPSVGGRESTTMDGLWGATGGNREGKATSPGSPTLEGK